MKYGLWGRRTNLSLVKYRPGPTFITNGGRGTELALEAMVPPVQQQSSDQPGGWSSPLGIPHREASLRFASGPFSSVKSSLVQGESEDAGHILNSMSVPLEGFKVQNLQVKFY